MSRLRLCLQVLGFAVISWIVLAALWLGLPSPCADGGDASAYATSLLQSGKMLTVVYECVHVCTNGARPLTRYSFDHFYPSTWHLRHSFAVDYHVDFSSQTIGLPGYRTIERPDFDQSDSLIQTFVSGLITVKTGDRDGINPPWFNPADSTLLWWHIHRETHEIGVRLVWTEDKQIEIWPDFQPNDSEDDDDGSTSDPRTSSSMTEPLLVVENIGFATEGSEFRAVLPQTDAVSLPSRTYPLRAAIVTILAPSGIIGMEVLTILAGLSITVFNLLTLMAQSLVAYVVIATVWWCLKGRPPLAEYVETLILYTVIQNVIHLNEGTDDKADVDATIERRHIRGPADFFRSTAPLDDLLHTFESTRHLTQPIRVRKPRLEPAIHHAAIDLEANDASLWDDEKGPAAEQKTAEARPDAR